MVFYPPPIVVYAFVALGGSADLKGAIKKDKLVSVLLQDFELTLDVEVFIFPLP